jgi:MoCo/4Fe-4S cofactor protein with predicted Tat translocation signal
MPEEPGRSWVKALRAGPVGAHWRGVEELLRTPEYRASLEREFPAGAAKRPDGISRRGFVQLLGASATLAGLTACERPVEKILPYTDQPPEVTPGVPQYYATSMVVGGYATGLLVESHAGRPVKVEGNPEHPASLGAAGVYEQASALQLYDPERAREIRHGGEPASWNAFVEAFGPPATGMGEGLRFLLEPTGSPLLLHQLARIRELYPAARVHFHAPLSAEASWAGSRLAFGRPLQPHYELASARVILSLDADLLAGMPFHLHHARAWAEQRRIPHPTSGMNRLYVAEGMLSVTGGAADNRLRVRPSEVRDVAAGVLAEVVLEHGLPAGLPPEALDRLERFRRDPERHAWIREAARDLVRHRESGVVVAGERQTPEVHALAHLLNAALGNLGRTVHLTEPVLGGAGEPEGGLEALVGAMRAGEVETLVILEANPAYTAPADLEFARLLPTVPNTVCLDLYATETARLCGWFLPALHYLESWGDARAYDGTVSLVQPLVRPLYEQNRTAAQVLAAFLGEAAKTPHQLLREYWRGRLAGDFESRWEEALRAGFLPGTEAPRVEAAPRWGMLPALLRTPPVAPAAGLEAVFLQDPSVYDGRFANNAWLQELPDPVTKLTWDNAAIVSPRTAVALGVEQGEVLEVRHAGRALRIPAFVLPGVADGLLAMHLGYGYDWGDALATDVGSNAYLLRTSETPYFARDIRAARVLNSFGLPAQHPLATTQSHWSMEGRPIVLHASLAEYRNDPHFVRQHTGRSLSLYNPFPDEGVQWGMSIDLTLCTGCSACVVACQAENNVPVVGREGVLKSREMHWLRIDRYFSGTPEDPVVLTQPMLCQHCEKAPCEYVCPVNATVHSPDGLNEMIYNRCVGTRFCSNNCPYKVRRFNWFDYNQEKWGSTVAMLMNPDVTVRERGVMEKCTFCVQRIRRAQIDAEIEGEDIRHRGLQTACQQACPTRAIVFGPLTDPDSPVAQARKDPRSYAVLHDLGTDPRVKYLARINNPNPALVPEALGEPEPPADRGI